jgi:uncharacterized protein (DUF2147 family)
MKTTLLIIILIATNYLSNAQDQILGKYLTPKKDGKVEIFKRDNKYFGKITYLKTPENDDKNPNESLRSKPVVGQEFLKNFKYDGKKTWEEGIIYDAESGKTYDCTITLDADNNMNARGYIGISLFGRTEIFERIKE